MLIFNIAKFNIAKFNIAIYVNKLFQNVYIVRFNFIANYEK